MGNLDIALLEMREAHKGQTRWDGVTPYEVHPIAVVKILRDMGVTDDDMLCAGYLHDVLEDTNYADYKIKDLFGNKVLKLVQELTNPKSDVGDGITDEAYWSHIEKMSIDAKIVKMADMIANCTDKSGNAHFYMKRFHGMKIILRELISYRNAFV